MSKHVDPLAIYEYWKSKDGDFKKTMGYAIDGKNGGMHGCLIKLHEDAERDLDTAREHYKELISGFRWDEYP